MDHRNRGRPKSFNDKTGQNVIQSLDRALDVMQTLANGGMMTLSEIASQMGQSPATIYRVLTTLELRGVVEVDRASQTWAIGATAFQLGAAFLRRTNVVERSRPVMRDLTEATGETSNLGIEKSGAVIFVSQVETHETIRAFFPPGTQSPLHASGIGKALMACFSAEQLDRYLATATLDRFTENTITNPDALRTEMETIRAQGYALDDEEKAPGMRCIASPVLNMHGEAVAGISVSGPSSRITPDDIEPLAEKVMAAAAEVSTQIGAPTDQSPSAAAP